MKTTIISYSLTGNNEILAANLAQKLSAEHIKISESGKRSMGKIAMDMLFNRTPEVQYSSVLPENNDLIIFVAPVWMGKIAAPIRGCLKKYRKSIDNYAFVSISGGALGPNPKLAQELTGKLGKSPAAVIDQHIVKLLPAGSKPGMKDTSSYLISKEDTVLLTDHILKELKHIVK